MRGWTEFNPTLYFFTCSLPSPKSIGLKILGTSQLLETKEFARKGGTIGFRIFHSKLRIPD